MWLYYPDNVSSSVLTIKLNKDTQGWCLYKCIGHFQISSPCPVHTLSHQAAGLSWFYSRRGYYSRCTTAVYRDHGLCTGKKGQMQRIWAATKVTHKCQYITQTTTKLILPDIWNGRQKSASYHQTKSNPARQTARNLNREVLTSKQFIRSFWWNSCNSHNKDVIKDCGCFWSCAHGNHLIS